MISSRLLSRLALVVTCISLAAAARVPSGEVCESALQAASQVSTDSLDAMLRFLTIDPSTAELRSRFTFREAELAEVADSLSVRLERYTGCPVERSAFTVSDEYYAPGTYTAENVTVRVPGTGNGSSVVIVCAHYDAIGVRTDGWRENWETMPAPGANDNGTGVAALMEAARILPDYGLPFDLQFVLFSAEELGKLGSIDFVDRCDSICAGEILGVINLDMIGYNEDGTAAGSILSDYASGWIADMIHNALPVLDPGLPLRIIKPGPSNWDHASFWENTWNGRVQHIPAVTLAEPLHGDVGTIQYPYYHSVGDTIGWIDLDQTARITRVLVGFVAAFSGLGPEMAVLPSDLLLRSEETSLVSESFTVGEGIAASVLCRNIGGEDPPVQTTVTLTVTLENANGIRTLYAGNVDPAGPLKAEETTVSIAASQRDAGENWLRARISVQGFDDGMDNNEAEARFVVHGEGAGILAGHHFRPNPITSAFHDAEFCVNLAAQANVLVELYTIEGERIGTGYIGQGYGRELDTGNNCIACNELFPEITELVSGIYLYRIKVYDFTGETVQRTGQFAVLN